MASRKHQITAFIYDKRGKVLSIGQNSYVRTHPLQAKYAHACGLHHKIFVHAEIDAISKCRHLDKAHRMLVTRYGANDKPMLAKPCKICESAIEQTPIKEVTFTV